MITRDDLRDSFLQDFAIVKHLAAKAAPGMLEYRPSPQQRSLLELLKYLSRYGIVGLRVRVKADRAEFGAMEPESAGVTLENFQEAMDRQIEEFTALFDSLTDAQLTERIDPFGRGPTSRATTLLGHLKQYASYKMQLFLYLKAAGRSELMSDNLWRGIDPAPRD